MHDFEMKPTFELSNATKHLKNNKAVGSACLPGNIFKYGASKVNHCLNYFISDVWNTFIVQLVDGNMHLSVVFAAINNKFKKDFSF